MSIYDEIKATKVVPPYAHRAAFTKYHGYAKGVHLGLFDHVDDAKAAGATVTEKTFDEEGYKATQDTYVAFSHELAAEWYAKVRAEHPEVNDKVFAIIQDEAYDRGHSAGYDEVESYIDSYAELALKIIKAHSE
jgi:hypothetical protein